MREWIEGRKCRLPMELVGAGNERETVTGLVRVTGSVMDRGNEKSGEKAP